MQQQQKKNYGNNLNEQAVLIIRNFTLAKTRASLLFTAMPHHNMESNSFETGP